MPTIFRVPFPRIFPVVGLALLAFASSAAPVTETFNLIVASVDPGVTAIAPGDRFTITFTIDDAIVDTNTGNGAGTFPGLVTAFTITADPTNTGTWDPSGGTLDTPASNYVTNAFGDSVTLQVHGNGFPDSGAGFPLWDFSLGFGVPFDLTDSGVGDPFAQQLAAGGAIDFETFAMSVAIRFRAGEFDFREARLVIHQAAEPIPVTGPTGLAAVALLLAVAGYVVLRR